jgi:nitrate/nitrite-specific signal transduction histidine kinase
MPERAALIGGRLTVRREPDAGTEVELRVPHRLRHLAPAGVVFNTDV